MIHFERLRLSGFKSFVDPTEVPIAPGVTGVVGPNGCGKSNLVEALSWVMGESSARQMRGSEMDDVIFGGTANRPARNLAEASLLLDNRERGAPSIFNDSDQLEVVRRIDRGRGSTYRVNGREARARDVHILFADAATGARSTAIINQGRIGLIISAKPSDRRGLLEEAAGIGGLHSRRHEAELRLRAAEANLQRLDDVIGALDTELNGLKRQARQAARYRALSQQIREAEAKVLAARWTLASAALEDAKAALAAAGVEVERMTGIAAQAAARRAEVAAKLPELRRAETEAAGTLQRLAAARERLQAEEEALAAARRDLEQRRQQIAVDSEREAARAADAAAALARLEAERGSLLAASEGQEERERRGIEAVEQASTAAKAAEAELNAAIQAAAQAEARRVAAQRALAEAEGRRRRLASRVEDLAGQVARARAEAVAEDALAEAAAAVASAQTLVDSGRTAALHAEQGRAESQTAQQQAREALQGLSGTRTGWRAEAKALTDLLARSDGRASAKGAPPVLDAVRVAAGFETAFGAALGEDLTAPVDADAPAAWRTLAPHEDAHPLPAEARPVAAHVTAPPALARRLAQIGLVADAAAGARLQPDLKPGQSLVTVAGDLFRWDGFVVRAGAPAPAAARLHQRNRLEELTRQIAEIDASVAAAEAAMRDATAAAERAASVERQAREELRRAETDLAGRRDHHARLAAKAAGAASRVAALAEQEAAARADLAEAETSEAAARQAAATEPADDGLKARAAMLRGELTARHARMIDAQSWLDRLRREVEERRRRLEGIAAEIASWTERAAAAARHGEELAARGKAVADELERLATQPAQFAARRQALLGETAEAEAARRLAAAALADGEQAQTAADRGLREAEQALSAAREERVRREAALAAAGEATRGLAERIAERLDLSPAQLVDQAAEAEPVGIEAGEDRLLRLQREREGMGPVNLRAETEAEELEKRIATLNEERADLTAAIARLRRAIGEINQEGRQRLLESFTEVDRHFSELFLRLFGGGRAHLSLTESEDPLEAGLEIMASPPGKKLQVLSLLSGGEQALTALALLFAVFLTNPAPICVLDEVDAPLDDANVDRFCTLVAEIAETTRTRFLVVTHHRMTMARVDRLFGVTMAERGVSTLVSVDLDTAVSFRETA